MKALCATLLVLVLPVAASAAGLNLAWNNCYPSPGAALNQNFICDDSSPGAGDANTQTFKLYGSVVTGFDIAGVLAWDATIDMRVANPTLDSWWQLGTGDCREGAALLTFNSFNNTTTCNTQLMPPPQSLGVSQWQDNLGPNAARLRMVVARTTAVTMTASTEYQLFCIVIDSRNTKVNAADGTTWACAGCLDPACFVFNQLIIEIPPVGAFNGQYVISNETMGGSRCNLGGGVPDHRNYVTWQSGTVPVKRTTWGLVRSLYR